MIRKLQLKFVAVCMTLVMVVLGAVLVSIFLSARQNLEVLSHQVLQRVIREDTSHGTVPSQQPDLGLDIGGKEVVLPYFTVVLWEDRSGNYTAYVTGGTYSNLQGTEELSTVLQECLAQKQEEGTLRTYNLRYLRQDNGLFQKIAFVDTSMQQATLQEMMSSHIQIAVAAFFLLLAISIALARWATAPGGKGLAAAAPVPLRRLPRAQDASDGDPLQCGAAAGRAPFRQARPLEREHPHGGPADEKSGGGDADSDPGGQHAPHRRAGGGLPLGHRGGLCPGL